MFRSNRLHRYCLVPAILVAGLLSTRLLQPSSALAQAGSASVSGRVTDQTNAVMPDVEVEIKNVDMGVSQITKTNGDGFYSFPELRPGNYLMSVRKQSFQTVSVTGITLNVQDNLSRNFVLQVGSSAVSVTVTADKLNVNTTDGSVSTVVDRNFVESLPLNGRSFNTLLQLTPGVVIAQATPGAPGQFSISGQRTDANNFTVDGASANFGVGLGQNLSQSGTGGAQAFSAIGGTSSLVSVEALQEFRIETSSFAPEFGRSPGGQVILTTRSGTNNFHGGIFDYFRNTVMDANDWFANNASHPRAPEHHNDFGGFLGGPIWKDKTFFFFSYEGAKLDQPQTIISTVPSAYARSIAPAALAPYLNAFPLPDDKTITAGMYTSPFTGTFPNTATLNATSLRIDHKFGERFSAFGRYNYAPSQTAQRLVGFSLSDRIFTDVNTQTAIGGLNMAFGPRVTNTLRGNYSQQNSGQTYALDTFGGAKPLDPSLLLGGLPAGNTLAGFQGTDTKTYFVGSGGESVTRQINFADDLTLSLGRHQVKIGVDYRMILLDVNTFTHEVLSIASTKGLVTTGTATVGALTFRPAQFAIQSTSLYGQDTWRVASRLNITYGVRWELSPAPSGRGNTTIAVWQNVNNPAQLALAPTGTSLWATSYTNFAPRLGLAYSLTPNGTFVLRAGAGIFYDLGVGSTANLAFDFPNSARKGTPGISVPVADVSPYLPSTSLQPPFAGVVQGFSPSLKLPRSYQWNVALEKSFAAKQVLSATYVGQHGQDLLRQEALFKPNANFPSDFVLTQNSAWSNYNALELQYRRPLASRVQALVNYTWSHSLDNASDDSLVALSNSVISGANDYGSSGFDVRQSFSGALNVDIRPASQAGLLSVLTRNWALQTVVVVRSGFPFNAKRLFAAVDPGGFASIRPDRLPGQPLWIAHPGAPGGKVLNYNPVTKTGAFQIPSAVRQGTEGRNDIPGFGLTQVDLSLGRRFVLTDRLNLLFRADAFNLFNHPNFANPGAFIDLGSSFLQSQQMLNQGLGGLGSLFQEGGPRSLQLSLKVTF